MYQIMQNTARFFAIVGGVVLTMLAILMTISITGGVIAKFGNSDWLQANAPQLSQWIQDSGIRTIRGMYEIIKYGIAFVIFSFLPITTFDRAHAVVDVFTNFLPARLNQFLVTFWEVIFFIILALITWRLYFGMERMISSHMISQELKIPEWWAYLIAFIQMIIASVVSFYIAYLEVVKLVRGDQGATVFEGETK